MSGKTTRRQIKQDIEAMITKLESIDYKAVEIGMITDKSDASIAGVMYAISLMVETVIPLLKEANKEL